VGYVDNKIIFRYCGGSKTLSDLLSIMSLISQKDRALVIEALEHYKTKIPSIINVKDCLCPLDISIDTDEKKMMELNALINWIKLEYQKNEH